MYFCGGGGSRTRVRNYNPMNVYTHILSFNFIPAALANKLCRHYSEVSFASSIRKFDLAIIPNGVLSTPGMNEAEERLR